MGGAENLNTVVDDACKYDYVANMFSTAEGIDTYEFIEHDDSTARELLRLAKAKPPKENQQEVNNFVAYMFPIIYSYAGRIATKFEVDFNEVLQDGFVTALTSVNSLNPENPRRIANQLWDRIVWKDIGRFYGGSGLGTRDTARLVYRAYRIIRELDEKGMHLTWKELDDEYKISPQHFKLVFAFFSDINLEAPASSHNMPAGATWEDVIPDALTIEEEIRIRQTHELVTEYMSHLNPIQVEIIALRYFRSSGEEARGDGYNFREIGRILGIKHAEKTHNDTLKQLRALRSDEKIKRLIEEIFGIGV